MCLNIVSSNRAQTQTEKQTNVSMTMFCWQNDTITNPQMPNATKIQKCSDENDKHLLKGFATLRKHEHVTCVCKCRLANILSTRFAKINHCRKDFRQHVQERFLTNYAINNVTES